MRRGLSTILTIVIGVVIIIVAVVGIWYYGASRYGQPAQTAAPSTGTPVRTATTSQASYTFRTISFQTPSVAGAKVQQTENSMRIMYPDGGVFAIFPGPDLLKDTGPQAVALYKSVLGSSSFVSNYAFYSYLLQLTTSSIQDSKTAQEAKAKSVLLILRDALILTSDNHDISSKNQNGINGIEGMHNGNPLIAVFDNRDMLYTFIFKDFSAQEAEAMFSSIKPAD